MSAVLPGATIGFLGGGQLGRMSAMAARALGYRVAVLDPDPDCAAAAVADDVVVAPFDDPEAAGALADRSAVVTFEIERIGLPAARAAARRAPLRPGTDVLEVIQDRARQKRFLADQGVPLGPWAPAASAAEASAAARAWGGPVRIKAARGGYDGRGQARAAGPETAAEAFLSLGGVPCVVEREHELELELSVLVARRPSGQTVSYPAARNWHEDGILVRSVMPGVLPAEVGARADAVARRIAAALRVEGLLAVELFLTRSGELLVNELSPRPHNTFHATETACATSQFEQLVRAVCDLPLGSTDVLRPTAITNLLGDLWLGPAAPDLEAALARPGVGVRLYGKAPRPSRKLGHLIATASTPGEALRRVSEARRLLGPG
ncbi:MAG TPA: 5-(carboxyamino)imidazole ribonucleotide synthase [Anaeromyxobacteraceae bacterium]|nr:5-(carboxyamino)imidazole ribonucleotide synthase [Anaeromyxobacteraceae bacterium]